MSDKTLHNSAELPWLDNFNLNLMVNDHWSLVRVVHGHDAGCCDGHVHEEERLIPGVFRESYCYTWEDDDDDYNHRNDRNTWEDVDDDYYHCDDRSVRLEDAAGWLGGKS